MTKYYFLIFIFSISFSTVSAQISFVDVATIKGIGVATGTSPWGNGVTFHDYDGDGWDDITLTTETGAPLRFFKNNSGTFTEEFLITPAIIYRTKQVNWVDIDNDGDKDLFVTSDTDGNRLFENTGSMALVDISTTSGIPTTNMYTYGASWGDYNNDGFLDVYVSNRDEDIYVTPNYLYRNNQDGTFTDVSSQAGLNTTAHSSFCSAFFDFNNDGLQDIFVANDRYVYENYMLKNNGDGTFTEVGASSGAGLIMDAMSATIDDFNHDGWFDIYITNTFDGNVFLMNNGDETFTDISVAAGTTFDAIAWGSVFLDADNDMDLDLYVSGRLDGVNPDLIPYAFYENNNDGTFYEPVTGLEIDDKSSYSNAIGDFDQDGLFDILVSNNNGDALFLWNNTTASSNNWLKVELEGTASNRDGIGSVIEIGIGANKQYRYTLCGEGYLSQNSNSEIFGLGSNTSVDYVKVTWLSGIVDWFYNVNANQLFSITEGNGTLSISNLASDEIKVFPNPVENIVQIKSSEQIKTIEIQNSLGQHLGVFDFNKNNVNLDVSYLSSGQYFLIINTAYTSYSHKFLRN